MSEMSVLSGRAGEAATMLRDCSAKAQMLASELKYASLAAWICEDPALAEERQALSDETRERAMAADKLAAEIMRVIRSLSVSMSAVSAAVPQASAALHIDSAEGEAAARQGLGRFDLQTAGGLLRRDPHRPVRTQGPHGGRSPGLGEARGLHHQSGRCYLRGCADADPSGAGARTGADRYPIGAGDPRIEVRSGNEGTEV